MIIEDRDKRLSHHGGYLKDYNSEDLIQLTFDFTSSYKSTQDILLGREYRSIYKKKDGSIIVRVTKYRPIQDSDNWVIPGHINGYGHELLDYYEQYKFKF